MRGDLVSRPVGDVLSEARGCSKVGREGAAGDQPGHQRLRRRRQIPHRLLGRQAGQTRMTWSCASSSPAGRSARRLGAAALRLSVPARRRDPAADGQRAASCPLPGRVPAFAPRGAPAHEAAGQRRAQPGAPALGAGLPEAGGAHLHRRFPGETEAEFEHLLDFHPRGADRPRRLLRLFAGGRRGGQRAAGPAGRRAARRAAHASWRWPKRCRARKLAQRVSARPCRCWSTGAGARPQPRRRGAHQLCRRARRSTAACACLPPEKASKTSKVGEFTRPASSPPRPRPQGSARRSDHEHGLRRSPIPPPR